MPLHTSARDAAVAVDHHRPQPQAIDVGGRGQRDRADRGGVVGLVAHLGERLVEAAGRDVEVRAHALAHRHRRRIVGAGQVERVERRHRG
jgi:hypothetical protein